MVVVHYNFAFNKVFLSSSVWITKNNREKKKKGLEESQQVERVTKGRK